MANPKAEHKDAAASSTRAPLNSEASRAQEKHKDPKEEKAPKRAITLGGGGPAAGLHIGVLEALEDLGIHFDVWALSCIGAWVGIVYNLREGRKKTKAEETYEFFRDNVFRSDKSYKGFPVNSVFGPDWGTNMRAIGKFLFDQDSYINSFPSEDEMKKSIERTWSLLTSKYNEGDVNHWILNDVMAVNPMVRFLTSMIYLSESNGLSRIFYPNCKFLEAIKFKDLQKPEQPYIYHNAWNLSTKQLDLFYNKAIEGRPYGPISSGSLCACSALPFVESTVELSKPGKLDKNIYCEGALVDTVNFKNLLQDHFDLDEIWISRIVDADQVRPPKDLHDSLGNLCELFAATVGEDDVKLFKYYVEFDDIEVTRGEHKGETKQWKGTIVEIHVGEDINFEWTHSNLTAGRDEGKKAAEDAYRRYKAHKDKEDKEDKAAKEDKAVPRVKFVNELPSEAYRRQKRHLRAQHEAR